MARDKEDVSKMLEDVTCDRLRLEREIQVFISILSLEIFFVLHITNSFGKHKCIFKIQISHVYINQSCYIVIEMYFNMYVKSME